MNTNQVLDMVSNDDQIFLSSLYEQLRKDLIIEELPIVFESMEEDSKVVLPTQVCQAKIVINEKYKGNALEIAKNLCFQDRKIYQIEYASFIDKTFNTNWVKELRNEVPEDEKILDLDAYAYTRYFLKEYFNIDVTYPNEAYEQSIEEYIKNFKLLLEC